MLMIVSYHYSVHGQSDLINSGDIFQKIFLRLFSMYGKIGVNIFVLISGYLGIEKKFKLRKIFNLEIQTLFFSWSFLVLFCIWNFKQLNLEVIFKSVMPVLSNQYWFITSYVVLYVLTPWLNKLLLSLDQFEYRRLILVLLIMWSVIPCLTFQETDGLNLNQQIWMFVMYIVGAYIKRFGFTLEHENSVLLFFNIILIGTVFLFSIVGMKIRYVEVFSTYFRWSNSIVACPISMLLFDCFSKKRMKYNRVINYIGSGTLSVYLIHENVLVSSILWRGLCKKTSGILLILNSFLSILIVFGIGILGHVMYKKIASCLNIAFCVFKGKYKK